MNDEARISVEAEAYVAKLETPIMEMVKALRQLVLAAAPNIEETIKWGMLNYSQSGVVCYIGPGKTHVTFGFYRGADLPDPDGLLEGKGKKMRHIKIRRLEDIRADVFIAWVKEAAELNKRVGNG